MSTDEKFDFEKNITSVEMPRTSTGTATVNYDYKGVTGTLCIKLNGFDLYGNANVHDALPADGNYKTPARDFVGPRLDAEAAEQFSECFASLVWAEFPQDRETAVRNGEIHFAQERGELPFGLL